MTPPIETLPRKSRLAALLEHFAEVEDPRDMRRILHPLPTCAAPRVCGTIANCDDYEDIAAWGAAHPDFLLRAPALRARRSRRRSAVATKRCGAGCVSGNGMTVSGKG
jgi:hypothetical protein